MDADKNVALVTGGAQGIGRAIASLLLQRGWRLAIVDKDGEAALEAERDLGAGDDFLALVGNVAEEEDVRRTVAATRDRFGRLDGLVNNAGISGRKPFDELTLEDWNRVLGVNLTGAYLFARHATESLRAAHGAIVNIASTRALMSEPGSEAYAASKGGLVALTHALALSLGPEVRVNCISPGWIDVSGAKKSSARRQEDLSEADHAQHPAGRVGTPEDVAATAAFLLGGEAGFITGTNFVVDGGMTRKMMYA